jgi:ubiquinone/menaquinone biosynthesis C-methylase UbiE
MAMDHKEVGKYWNSNADAWTKLARAGYDVYRDFFNTPQFLEMLPDVKGLRGLDIGCGEGHNTRLVSKLGAHLTAVDIAGRFVRHAYESEQAEPLGIDYQIASAVELPFKDDAFDFATAFMSFMDIPETWQVISEAYRVLKPGGFLQFSITHPCTDTPHRVNLRDEQGITYALEVGGYFKNREGEVIEWVYSSAPPEAVEGLDKFKMPVFTRTISQWINGLIDQGFVLEQVGEPTPTDEAVRQCPEVQDAQIAPYFLHLRARKPGR